MNKKISILISIVPVILALLVLFEMDTMTAKAGDSERNVTSKRNEQSVICAVNTLLMHEAQLRRLNFALSDGRGGALGWLSFNPYFGQDPCGINLRRLEFALSDGGKIHLGEQVSAADSLQVPSLFNPKRLEFALSDGNSNILRAEAESEMGINGAVRFNPRRLEYALTDGRRINP